MGVKTPLSLREAQTLFPYANITQLTPTTSGVIDTTYLTPCYVLKKYERAIEEKIAYDTQLLHTLAKGGLRVPQHIATNHKWHLYTRLEGRSPINIHTHHILTLARFMAKLHTQTRNTQPPTLFLHNINITHCLRFTKQKQFYYYKKLQHLAHLTHNNDGFIHGDIFKDNCVFANNTMGVFDFIDGGGGSFVFDCAVALMAFSQKSRLGYNTQLFLRAYNQKAPKKITLQTLTQEITNAKHLYALLRIHHHKTTRKAKGLL
jgi:Ser/Thr protein kinase RdoA (MazF antagonist)